MHITIILLNLLVTVSTALVAPLTTASRSDARAQIKDYTQGLPPGGNLLDDEQLGTLLARLQSTADETRLKFDPKSVADLRMTSCVKYVTSTGDASGWLCTSGHYTIEPEKDLVRIVWDRAWWNADERDRSTPPEEGIFPALIQKLGEIGFMEPLSFFPVKYVDDDFAIFQFFGFTISAMKQADPQPGILVSDKMEI